VAADAAVNKKTLVVQFGISSAAGIYKITLVASYIIAAVMVFAGRTTFFAGLFYLFTLPIGIVAIKAANKRDLAVPGQYRANQITVLLHTLGSLSLAVGFIITAMRSPAI
jgi:1,4-dihydroxy-2-naphthoate octaprenyltransferase